ncbi:MAG: glycosyltransferase family 9 protein, partial [Bacteroidota bacterium]
DALPEKYQVYLLGAPGDQAACDYIAHSSKFPRVRNLAGQLSLLQSAALMEKAQMNYVNDSAPMHLASSRNAPTTVVYCSTVPAFGFGPLSDIAHIIQIEEGLDCRPCGIHGHAACPKGHFRCARDIKPEKLLEVLA